MKKKLLALLLCAAMTLGLAACGKEDNQQAADSGEGSKLEGDS